MRFFFDMTPIGKTLLAGSALLHAGLIALSLSGILPPGTADFFFFFFLATLAALYRPGWMFLLLIATLPLESVNLAPMVFGTDLRPYQFLVAAISVGLLIRFLSKRALPEKPTLGWADLSLGLVVLGSFPAILNAPDPGASFRLSIILLSFYALYLLARTYLRSVDDVKRILPFALVSGAIVLCYALFQNIRFLSGLDAFEVMPGRPDGGFPEPDWLGMYLVFFGAMLLSLGAAFQTIHDESGRERMVKHISLAVFMTVFFSVLLMTVSRSAWLGTAISGIAVLLALSSRFQFFTRKKVDVEIHGMSISWNLLLRGSDHYDGRKRLGIWLVTIAAPFLVALALAPSLTRFDLSGRADSIASGNQKITVSCDSADTALPRVLHTMDELSQNNCRHIDLEEIDTEKLSGKSILTVLRPDPNVDIRKDIYAKSWSEIREHPLLGIGWGSISPLLGTDGRGTGLNASNVFLEIWLGSGIMGLLGFLGFIVLVLVRATRNLLRPHPESGLLERALPIFILSAIPGLLVFDLFNSGILLGFLWVFFASTLADGRTDGSPNDENGS